jgi:hypothetical protein
MVIIERRMSMYRYRNGRESLGGLARWIVFCVDEFEEESRLEETKIRITFHHVLDPSLGTVEHMPIRIARLDVGQSDESRFGIQVDLLINKREERISCLEL